MADLAARPAGAGAFPLEAGGLRAAAVEPGPLWLVMPYPDRVAAVAGRLGGLWPEPGRSAEGGGRRALWWGREAALVEGPPPEGLGDLAAVVAQSDAWCVARLEGEGAEDALARLVPIDLRPRAFAEGAVARTLLGHVAVGIARRGGALEIWAPRSMAGTVAHDLGRAMRGVAARREGTGGRDGP